MVQSARGRPGGGAENRTLRNSAGLKAIQGESKVISIDGFGMAIPNRIFRYTERFRFGLDRTEPNRNFFFPYRTEPSIPSEFGSV